MPTPQETFNAIVEAAKQKVQAEAAAQSAAAQARLVAGPEQVTKTLSQIAEALPRIVQQTDMMGQRIAALEGGRGVHRQSVENDPYENLSDFGLNRNNLAPVLEHELNGRVEKAVNSAIEKSFGPSIREAAAIQEYQSKNPEFDLQRVNTYLAKNPEVKQIVDNARQNGAYEIGIRYAETRMQIDDKIATEARGQMRREARQNHVEATRGDAAVLGGTGANGTSRTNVAPTMTPEQIEGVFARANAGDYRSFEKAFVHPNLPSEEWFQQLAQS